MSSLPTAPSCLHPALSLPGAGRAGVRAGLRWHPFPFSSGQVCSINSRFAKVHILYVGSTPLKSTFRGTIR